MANVDQRRIDNQHPGELSARAAAALLDVKLSTLYAYVSRGLVRSVPGPAGRPRRYARADIERLKARRDARKGHGAVAAGALRWGEPVLDTGISDITAGGPRYRGYDALELAREQRFEAVAELLWTGELGPAGPWPETPDLAAVAALDAIVPAGAPPMDRLIALMPVLAARDPQRFAATADAELARARRLMCTMIAALDRRAAKASSQAAAGRPRTVAERVLLAMPDRARDRAGSRARARRHAERVWAIVDQALILVADHELNASTFAARVVASAGADLYACVGAGLAALSGPLHGGMCDRVEALARECGAPARARQIIVERTRRGEPIPGFGHPLYPEGDPRARALLAAIRRLGGASRDMAVLEALAQAMARAGREPPSVDLALVTLGAALGLRPGAGAAIFALGRTAGWIAHVLEQRAAGFLLRPRARYVADAAPRP